MSKSWAEVVKVSLNRFVQPMTQKEKKKIIIILANQEVT